MAYGLTKSLDLEESSSQYADIASGSQTGLNFTSNFSLEGWINLESLPSVTGHDYFVCGRKGATEGYSMWVGTDDKLHCRYGASGTNVSEKSMNETFDSDDLGTWIHVAVTVNVGSISFSFYKGGTSKASTYVASGASSLAAPTASFAIGKRPDTAAGYFDGGISLVRVWSDIRTSGEISGNLCTVFGTTEGNMVGEWSLDDVYTDASGNSNTLTASGSPVFVSSLPSTCAPAPSSNSNFLAFF